MFPKTRNPYTHLTVDQANTYAGEHVDRQAQKAILSGEFTISDLKLWRKSTGLTQRQVALLIGYSRMAIKQVEREIYPPSQTYLKSFRQVARKLELGVLFTPNFETETDHHSYAYIPRSDLVMLRTELRKCANPHCANEVYMTKKRRFCSQRCAAYTLRHGLEHAHPNDRQRTQSYTKTGPTIATCPSCGHTFRTKGNTRRPNPLTANGGRANLP